MKKLLCMQLIVLTVVLTMGAGALFAQHNFTQIDAEDGLWQLIDAVCARSPEAIAVRDSAGRDLTYGDLRLAVERQSAALAAAGVRADDHVLLAAERSTQEIVAVLAVLRLGAAYIGLAAGTPPKVVAQIMAAARPRAVLCDHRHEAFGSSLSPPVVLAVDPWDSGAVPADASSPAPADPARIAYVAFTSGSTGVPKGVRITHRGVIRLARDPQFLVPGATDRFLRLAPLAFDASTLEIFAPLLAGGAIDIYPAASLDPVELAAFLAQRRITGLWLTAGLFQIVASHHPAAFRQARQLLTGGDVVPAAEVRQVLEHCPGLRVTNGYGPTENTTFTAVHHLDDPASVDDPVPIGRPIPGTGIAVMNDAGQPVPPGAIGELCAFGAGLAAGYLGAPGETSRAFPRSGSGERYYRTGDLVRWDGTGRLQFIGRRDQQVKIRGFRVEPDGVARILRHYPRVRDVIVTTARDRADRHLVAAIVADPCPDLLPGMQAFASQQLPAHSVPTRWAVIDTLPTTANGKVDLARLTQLAGVIPPASPP